MNYLDLFSGIGGFHEGLNQEAGFQFDNCFHAEVDKYACQVYHKHFPESRCLGDVRTDSNFIMNFPKCNIGVQTDRWMALNQKIRSIAGITSTNGTFQFRR